MRLSFKRYTILMLVLLFSGSLVAQKKGAKAPAEIAPVKIDTSKIPKIKPPSKGPKPYGEVITKKAKTDDGLFRVHEVDDKYYFEIPNSFLRREILVVNRISKAPSGNRNNGIGYAGDPIGQNVIWFERGPNDNIFLRTISFAEYAKDSSSPMFTAVNKSNIQPIEFAFDIKAFSKDSMSSVIDVTDFIEGDNDVLYLPNGIKRAAKLAALQKDKSYIVHVNSYPKNIEITAIKTYGGSPLGDGGNLTVELNSSMVLLPKEPMQARYADPRVGYFSVGYTDFDANPQGIERVSMIKRWRLEPKDEDIEKYKMGELVEPKNPIIYYIDPATPAKWIPYLMQGISDWQKAFEKAGFKNAIFGKRAPTKAENPEWSLEDARYSAIVYKPSSTANASGPSIADPRSGEILESHINWYHNVMSLLHHWYFVQAAAIDPRARKMTFDDELMGQLIRFVSSHEVGHTLGLRHNFGSSSAVPVENLRNKKWVELNGHTPSIMDYARFNYVAQPEDNISEKGIFPRIGDYDDWAIEWGYRRYPQYQTSESEKTYLNKWVIEKLKDKRLWYGDGEFYRNDPRNLTEQVGDDAVKGSVYGIKNLQRIVPNLMEWTEEPNKGFENLTTMYNQVIAQFNRYNNHVVAIVGGVMLTAKTVEQSGPVYVDEPKATQKDAVQHLSKYVFKTPEWLINKEIFAKNGMNGLTIVGKVQESVLTGLLSRGKLNNLVEAQLNLGNNAYSVMEFLGDVKKGVWSELFARQSIDIYRRQLQQAYVDRMDKLLNPSKTAPTGNLADILSMILYPIDPDLVDVTASLRAHLTTLKSEINTAANVATDQATKIHLKEMSRRIEDTLNPKK